MPVTYSTVVPAVPQGPVEVKGRVGVGDPESLSGAKRDGVGNSDSRCAEQVHLVFTK